MGLERGRGCAHLPWSRAPWQRHGWPSNLYPCPLCPQILLGHPPPYAADVTVQVPMAPTPATVLSPPLPEVLPPAVPELPQLPSSLASVVVAASQSLPIQTAPLLPPATHPPPPTGPGIASPCPAVQLTVEPAPEVCAPALRVQPLTPVAPSTVVSGLTSQEGGSVCPGTAVLMILHCP